MLLWPSVLVISLGEVMHLWTSRYYSKLLTTGTNIKLYWCMADHRHGVKVKLVATQHGQMERLMSQEVKGNPWVVYSLDQLLNLTAGWTYRTSVPHLLKVLSPADPGVVFMSPHLGNRCELGGDEQTRWHKLPMWCSISDKHLLCYVLYLYRISNYLPTLWSGGLLDAGETRFCDVPSR